jgi:hypothetical protein
MEGVIMLSCNCNPAAGFTCSHCFRYVGEVSRLSLEMMGANWEAELTAALDAERTPPKAVKGNDFALTKLQDGLHADWPDSAEIEPRNDASNGGGGDGARGTTAAVDASGSANGSGIAPAGNCVGSVAETAERRSRGGRPAKDARSRDKQRRAVLRSKRAIEANSPAPPK